MEGKIYNIEKKGTIIFILLMGMFISIFFQYVYPAVITSLFVIIIELSWRENKINS